MINFPTNQIEAINNTLYPVQGKASDWQPLMEIVGDKELVLIGEATHGTDEFYRARAEITKQLIQEKGFTAVAVEADWPDSYRVNRYLLGDQTITSPEDALSLFERFPTWMWRNKAVVDFLSWLHFHNKEKEEKIGFYGLDLYSMNASIREVLKYLKSVDKAALERAIKRYNCFASFNGDVKAYGFAASVGITKSCEKEIREELMDLRDNQYELIRKGGFFGEDEFFYAEQNARLIKNAEEYYKIMFNDNISSWNLRDQHMAETLFEVKEHLSKKTNKPTKIVVWAHNSHIGDARATELGKKGELNLGQLVREKAPNQTILIGFSTFRGTVSAASEWDGSVEKKKVLPALPESYEALFHLAKEKNFLLPLQQNEELIKMLHYDKLQRAIGVLYLPESERYSHYYYVNLLKQFDAMIHFDQTTAVEPLEYAPRWHDKEMLETYPSGL